MGYRFHGRAAVDPTRPRAWATCDRCGFNYNHHQLRFQFDFRGPRLMNLQLLVCDRCYDAAQNQLRPVILPPDPVPIRNPRPEPYADDEA